MSIKFRFLFFLALKCLESTHFDFLLALFFAFLAKEITTDFMHYACLKGISNNISTTYCHSFLGLFAKFEDNAVILRKAELV